MARTRTEIDIPAVREAELRTILAAYELQDAVDNRSAKCSSCGEMVGWENVAGLVVKEEGFDFVCTRPGCIEEAATRIHGR
jgi:hypothetical protein